MLSAVRFRLFNQMETLKSALKKEKNGWYEVLLCCGGVKIVGKGCKERKDFVQKTDKNIL